jgi:hypothetical protein
MVKEDLETKFKDPDDPFRLVLRACAVIEGEVFKLGEGKDGFIAWSYNRRSGGKELAG